MLIFDTQTVNTNVSDSSKLPSVNYQSKSNKELTINDDNQVHSNIERNTDPKTDKMIQNTENSDKSIISNSKCLEGNSSYLQFNESTDNDNTEVQTELKLPTNEEDIPKKSNIENINQSKSLSIKKDETINTDVSDSSKLPSLNNQSKSNKELTINDDSQVYPNIKLKTDPKTDKMIQKMDNSDKSKISNSKCLEGNSFYLQINKSTDNDNTEVQTELKLPTTEEDITKKSDIEKLNHSSSVSNEKDDIINTKLSDSSKIPVERLKCRGLLKQLILPEVGF